jgi:predicted N-acyltransferase
LPFIGEGSIEHSNHLKSKERNELKKANKKNTQFIFRSLNNIENQFPELSIIEIRDKMIKNKTRGKSFFDRKFINLTRDLFDHGVLTINLMSEANIYHSVSMNVTDKDSFWSMFWISMYDDDQLINIATYNNYINFQLKIDKNSTIDFGRGGYNYKLRNYLPIVKNVYNLEWGKSILSIFNIYIKLNLLYTKKLVKHFFNRNK